ncbi:MAG: helix-turn-helix domain-containing protein [Polyangiaceae bacterium]
MLLSSGCRLPSSARICHDCSMLVASRLRSVRKRKGMTIETLAAQAGIHKAHLSRIERGEKTPSLGTLMALAKALGVEMSELFGEKATASEISVVRKDERPRLPGDELYGVEAILAANRERPIAMYVVDPGPSFLEHDLPEHDGFEVLLVLRGSIEARVGDRLLALATGDCAAYDARLKHLLRKTGKAHASVLVSIVTDERDGRVRH